MSEKICPIRLEQNFLDGKGLIAGDAAEFDDYVESADGDDAAEISSGHRFHTFHSGKIEVGIYESGPGKVRIDGLPYDEYIYVLEGRLILSCDDGESFEFATGDSLVIPEGFIGYWEMPVKYRELIIINT